MPENNIETLDGLELYSSPPAENGMRLSIVATTDPARVLWALLDASNNPHVVGDCPVQAGSFMATVHAIAEAINAIAEGGAQ